MARSPNECLLSEWQALSVFVEIKQLQATCQSRTITRKPAEIAQIRVGSKAFVRKRAYSPLILPVYGGTTCCFAHIVNAIDSAQVCRSYLEPFGATVSQKRACVLA
ncbi:hypothetical protein NA78x_002122 [Anatilimnocola sp. NA78]|uniref:hypothetical protein n=1 Tax=Anatilimnocola sp. NA78 TaxID=3415683 RepID=UPI003CE59FC6